MTAASEHYVDPRRPVDRFLGNYSEDHRNTTNQRVHWICVPLIVWSVIALLWLLPVPSGFARQGLWAGLAMLAAVLFYLRLSRPLALAMLFAFAVLGVATHLLYVALGGSGLLWTAVAVFAVSWVAQFVGHEIEGKRPSFFTDVVYLLIGPLWLMSKLFRRLGLGY